ncbi:hypothetical protein GQ55_4G125700 [Panicum hallii var. hallii]|uniref:Uncharacterized protein n=1 Tax=Panicum hallii var. hallii TaxID=1504633 RepID=A0A2T7DXY5_9POAL|nr:hypothetical protein GQ55_4G125700 [Panicum hallii var. hallii]
MLTRMAMVGIVSLLVCTLVALTSEASNVWWASEVAFANEAYGNNNLQKQQHHEFTGYRPRLASFNRASDQANDGKRKVPTGPNCEHNKYATSPPYRHDKSKTSPSPSDPIDPTHYSILASPPYRRQQDPNGPPTWATLY